MTTAAAGRDPIWVSWSDSYTGCDILLVTSGLVEKVSAGSWNLITIFEDQFALSNGYQGVEIEVAAAALGSDAGQADSGSISLINGSTPNASIFICNQVKQSLRLV